MRQVVGNVSAQPVRHNPHYFGRTGRLSPHRDPYRILEELPPDELDAVFGHEVGHAKHGHIWLYAAFLLLSTTVLVACGLWAEQ